MAGHKAGETIAQKHSQAKNEQDAWQIAKGEPMTRHKARETALQMLFQLDIGKNAWEMAEYILSESGLTPIYAEFTLHLVKGTLEHQPEIDVLLSSFTRQWDVSRLANIDKNIIRMSLFELKYSTEIPKNVVINEAVELAKSFGSEDSASFVNAILDNISNQS